MDRLVNQIVLEKLSIVECPMNGERALWPLFTINEIFEIVQATELSIYVSHDEIL